MAELPPDLSFAGPRLQQVFLQIGDRSLSRQYQAAVEDARELVQKGEHPRAAGSYQYAIRAAKQGRLLGMPELLDLLATHAKCLLTTKTWPMAYGVAKEIIDTKPDYVQGYMLACQAWKGLLKLEKAADILLKGMKRCSLTNDDSVDFIVEAAIILGNIKVDWLAGIPPGAVINNMRKFKTPLPQTTAVWNRIMARLLGDLQFVAVAYLTMGFEDSFSGVPDLCALDGACPQTTPLDCSAGCILDIQEVLTKQQYQSWGNVLSIFLLERGAMVARDNKEPPSTVLASMSLKSQSSLVFGYLVLERVRDDFCVDAVNQSGETALHVIVKTQPYTTMHSDLVMILVRHGALPNIRDKAGKRPHEYVTGRHRQTEWYLTLMAALREPDEGFLERISQLKQDGNTAHRAKNSPRALRCYERAVDAVMASPYSLPRDLAVLYNNMAATYATMGLGDKAYQHAGRSIVEDPTFHKPYWRLGKARMEREDWRGACDDFLVGAACPEADAQQRALFITEVCSMLPSLTDGDAEYVVKKVTVPLRPVWPKVFEALGKTAAWDIIRRLVLGPPTMTLDRSAVPPGWRFADRYIDGKTLKVGYGQLMPAAGVGLQALMNDAENGRLTGDVTWVSDLVLALVLQGAPLGSLVTAGDEETGFHCALFLCCLTEKLGLMRYILSADPLRSEATGSTNREKRTLLHSACLQFGDGSSLVGRQLVQLLLEKGVNPAATDILSKKAVDYVAPHSPISQALLKPPAPQPKTREEMKERGNAEFKKGDYSAALDWYSQAISALQAKLPPDAMQVKGHEGKKHELAVLLSNRAECHLKMDRVEQAFVDAKESVGWDGHWYRGHVRVGRALVRKNKMQQAVKAYSNAFNALGMDATSDQKRDVLKELVKTVATHMGEQPPKLGLGYVTADVWALVVYDLLRAGNSHAQSHGPTASNVDWEAAKFANQHFSKARAVCRTLPSIDLSLKPLCCWQLGQTQMPVVVELMMFLLQCGCDHRSLTFYSGDTYVHAAAILTFMNANSSILDWLMAQRVKPKREENLQDREGNSALHLFASPLSSPHIPPPPLPAALRYDMLKILLDWGLNPNVRNKVGQRAIDCTDKKDRAVWDLLEKASRKAPAQPYIPDQSKPPPSQKPKPKPAAPATATATATTTSKTNNGRNAAPTQSRSASSTTTTTTTKTSSTTTNTTTTAASSANKATNGSAGKADNKTGTSGATKPDVQRPQCEMCEEIVADAKDLFSRDERTKQAYSKLVSLLGYRHQRDARHDKFVRESLDLIVTQLEKSLTPEVPDVLLRMSQSQLHSVLEKLAARDRWRQLEVVVEKARANDVPRGEFARNISITALVRDKGLCGAEPQRLQILAMLMSHGGQLHAQQAKVTMEAALGHGEFKVVQRLVELGVAPTCISLETGDTPLHVALAVALDKEKGNNFSLLEHLLALYEVDPTHHAYLDPQGLDKGGNSLLHAAARAHYSKHSHRAVELLMAKDVPLDARNAEGRLAIDYLRPHDRRTQYLRVAAKQSPSPSAAPKKKNGASASQTDPAPVSADSSSVGSAPGSAKGGSGHTKEDAGSSGRDCGADKLLQQRAGLKVKDAVKRLGGLVSTLSELTAAEARLAKTCRKNWLQMEPPQRVAPESVVDSEEESEMGDAPHTHAHKATNGHAQEEEEEEEDEEVEEEEEEDVLEAEKREKEDDEDEDIDLCLDGLEWEVECTAEVWKTLRDPRLTPDLKQRIVRSIKLLAGGEWRPTLCRKVRRVPDSIKLFQATFVKGGRILWELAVAFSPRLSEAAEKRMGAEGEGVDFAVKGGRMYTEIIRVWDIVFQHNKLRAAIGRVTQSHERGGQCLISRELKGVDQLKGAGDLKVKDVKDLKGAKSAQFSGPLSKRYPLLYSEADVSPGLKAALQEGEREGGRRRLYPPASTNLTEFHILKFYCFSSALVYNVLKNLEMKIDFPFRVTDREHAVINLQSRGPLLLLGRSGTGKTTCCLYRLWSRFLNYWTVAKNNGGFPWLPRTVQYAQDDDNNDDTKEEEDDDPNAELFKGLLDDNDKGDEDDGDDDEIKGATAASSKRSAKADRAGHAHKTQGSHSAPRGESESSSSRQRRDSISARKRRDSSCSREGRETPEGGEEEEEEEGEEVSEVSSIQYDHLHQLFVTKNQVLCSEVQKNFRALCHADDVARTHVETEETALPHRLQDVDHYKFPLFLTSRQLILTLDASLPAPHFFERDLDGGLRVTIAGWGDEEEIFAFVPLEDASDEDEADDFYQNDDDGDGGEGGGEGAAGGDQRPRKKDNRREVTYQVFAHEIWPKINKKAQVNYHPSLVWTEIISFIKGSFASLACAKGFLPLPAYQQLGRKQAPNFTGSRDKVYELFLRYHDYKRQHGLYDEADLVFNIYQRLKAAGPLPWVLHEVFVDETQDFTQAELTVLIRLAHDPNAMFLTGDTAQSIMRGVAFRFSDLKTLFHYAKASLRARGKTAMLEVPKHVYTLTHNYRSHAGILSLASAVLDLLVEFFPESFDALDNDQGLFEGPQPVVLESGSPADLAILLSGNKRKTSHIEFGAHQAILVVSEEARRSLPEELGMGLVLTIYEAKGLEFDDVLLYNFFKDSQAGKEWRVVTEFLESLSKEDKTDRPESSGLVEIDTDVLQQTGRPRPLAFDPNMHKILNSELKQLYTAVTRARVNVWIFDQDSERRAPMFEYFKARRLVKFVSMRDDEAEEGEGVSQSMFAERSSPAEWEGRGDEMMGRSLYQVAAKCYAMGNAPHKQRIAAAHQRALQASQLRAQPRAMSEAFLGAAILFLECHQALPLSADTLALRYNLVAKAARCLQNARENYLAAVLFEKNGQRELAAPLYLRAREWLAASQCYEHVDNFGRAVKILDEQELYDQAIDCLQRYNIRKQDFEKKGQAIPRALLDHKPEVSHTVASLSYKAAEFYQRYGKTNKMLAAIERLPDRDDQIAFLQKHGYLEEAATLMCQRGRGTEAARMMLHNGCVDRAMIIAEEGADNSVRAQCYWLKAQQLLAVKGSKSSGPAPQDEGKAGDPNVSQDKESSKKTPAAKSGKKKGEPAPSSDEEDGNGTPTEDTKKKAKALLERARQQFDLVKDHSGLGECQLALAGLGRDRQLLEQARASFSTVQPVANTAGMLQCVQMLHWLLEGSNLDLDSYRKLIWGVERMFEVVRVLLRPTTAEDKNRYQLFLRFYGLERAGEGRLVLHPKLRPRCVTMIGKELFETKEERKAERLQRPEGDVCGRLARFLIVQARDWCTEVDFHLGRLLPEVIQCHSFTEGRDCDDPDFCPYLHETYTAALSDNAINVLSSRVRLDHAVQSGAEALMKTDVSLSEVALSLSESSKQWTSVQTLLEFVLPAGVMTYNMTSVLTFCVSLARSSPLNAGVRSQVQRYLQHLWDNPGRVGKGRSANTLKERCKSTDWIVLASLLVPLFKLDIKVGECCQSLELDLQKKRPDWVAKRHKYALLADKGVVVVLARRHLDALEYLQPNRFDPFEAVIKFTKFVKLLHDRGEVGLMPSLNVFLFWLEAFCTLALCLAAKMRGNGLVVLATPYPRVLRLLNASLPGAQRSDLLRLMDEFKPLRNQPLRLLGHRIQYLVNILVGGRHQFSLLTHLTGLRKDKSTLTFLLAERSLALALTLLLNVEHGNVPGESEEAVLRCVNAIPESKLQDMPPRLASLIDAVQRAETYGEVRDALDGTLTESSQNLKLYQWRWNRHDREALQPMGPKTEAQTGGPFRVFRPHANPRGAAGGQDVPADDFDQIDEDPGTVADEEEEEEELSHEERERYQQQLFVAEREESQRKAIRVIVRLFRAIAFNKRMPKLKKMCVLQIDKDLFSPFIITHTMCGVCGVSFEKATVTSKTEKVGEDEGEEDDEETLMARFKQEHIASEEHRSRKTNFAIFRELYRSQLSHPLNEIAAFLHKHEVKKQRLTWYKDIPFQTNSVIEKLEGLHRCLLLTTQHRQWTQREELIHRRNDLTRFFTELARGPIISHYKRHQDQQQQKSANRDAERQHSERMTDGLLDDPTLSDILDVVERPLQARPQGGGGGGRRDGPGHNNNNSNNRPRGRGRGRVPRGNP